MNCLTRDGEKEEDLDLEAINLGDWLNWGGIWMGEGGTGMEEEGERWE